MNNLYTKQNEIAELQCAKNQLYREAVNLNSIALSLVIITAFVFPILTLLFPELKIILAIIGGVFGIVSGLGFKNISNKKVREAAKMQELFDVTLFGIDWNRSLVKGMPSEHEIQDAVDNNKKKKPSDFKDWYRDYTPHSQNMAALFCQQENLFWDSKQRKAYFQLLVNIAVLILALGIGLAFIFKLTPLDYLLSILFPQSGLVLYILIKIAFPHLSSAKKLNQEFSTVNRIAEKAKIKGEISSEELREIQDFIFESRKNSQVTPSWFYNLYKRRARLQEKLTKTAEKLNKDN